MPPGKRSCKVKKGVAYNPNGSATLSGGPEIYGRSGLNYLFSGTENMVEEVLGEDLDDSAPSDWQLFDKVRSQDIRLLKTLNVGTIVDFMVEKKKVKFGMNVTSSEKVDKENRYSEFTIISLPYPGCEFFKEYRDNDYIAQGLVFNWAQAHVDANIGIPDDPISSQLRIDWANYKMWDLVKLTQNYMKLLLRYLQENSTGLLIHCISGWDRTPLFVSLLRLSLWADGAIHQSLNAFQILYFTIAYDWLLFGHNLEDRLSKGEEIFFFCFYFLKHLVGDEYSVTPRKNKHPVIRNDSDLHLDGLLLDGEGPISSRGSNISLNSSCSSVSSKSQDNPPLVFHTVPDTLEEQANGNLVSWPLHLQSTMLETSLYSTFGSRSQHTSRTSPVAVPATSRLKQRNDSNSSLNVGSWQLISGTGSLRGSASTSTSTSTFDSATPSSAASQNGSHISLKMVYQYTNEELTDEILIYGEERQNSAARMDAARFPVQRHPNPRTFVALNHRLREINRFAPVIVNAGRPGPLQWKRLFCVLWNTHQFQAHTI
uniref:Myotubularin phosphatase domain-containing protein n=1 Tax=Timema genevievae TaxID=629358 RepID=A0A7R9PJ97_TIMGE|nr:unnamed protein product [Timema genevievae]